MTPAERADLCRLLGEATGMEWAQGYYIDEVQACGPIPWTVRRIRSTAKLFGSGCADVRLDQYATGRGWRTRLAASVAAYIRENP